MASLAGLRQEIEFSKDLWVLLDVLKSIAAQQFQALERSFHTSAHTFEAVRTIAAMLQLDDFAHPFTHAGGKAGVIAVTSDTGLLGGLNNQVINAAIQEYSENPGELIVIGKRGLRAVQEEGLPCREFPGIQDATRRRLALQVREYAIRQLASGRIGALTIVHPKALSFTVQRVEVVRAVPCQHWLPEDRPRGGSILLESSRADLLEYLLWIWLGETLVDVFGMSRMAEVAARSAHLEGSTQELQRQRKQLQQQFFRRRRELIDSSMRELFAARITHDES